MHLLRRSRVDRFLITALLPLAAIGAMLTGFSFGADSLSTVASAQQQTITIRPTNETDVLNVGNPLHARDDSESSSAGGSWGRVCRTDCTSPISATANWGGFPEDTFRFGLK
jgi:hypothetical protein